LGLTGLKEAAATGPTASMARAASEATGGLASAAGSEERSAASTVRSGVGGEVGVQELEEEGDGEGGG